VKQAFIAIALIALLGTCAAQSAAPEPEHRYELVKTPMTWTEAEAHARARGGHLVRIDSAEENELVFALLREQVAPEEYARTTAPDGGGAAYVWIGASDLREEGRWVWSFGDLPFWTGTYAGRPVAGRYQNWGRGKKDGLQHEPDNFQRRQDAAAIALTDWPRGSGGRLGQPGQWNDVDAGNKLFFVIEYGDRT